MLTFGLLRFQMHFTCSATLFLSFEVRACCDSAVDFTGKKVVSVVAVFEIEVTRNFYMTKLSKESALPVLVDFSVARGASLRHATVADGCLHCREESNFSFVPVAQTQCPSTSRRPALKKCLSSPILPCSRALLRQRKKQSLPDVRPQAACRIVDRSMDPEELTAKGQRRLATKPADRCARRQFSFAVIASS